MFKWFKEKFSKDDEQKIIKENYADEVNEVEQKVEFYEENNLENTSVEDIDTKEIVESNNELDQLVEGTLHQDEIKDNNLENETIDEISNIEEKEEIYEEVEEIKEESKLSIFQKLKQGLTKTRHEMGVKINTILGSYVKIDDEMLEDLEDILISADIGMETTMKLIDNLRNTIIQEKINDPNMVKPLLKEEVKKLMNDSLDSKIKKESPTIILVVGVNGVGKTTTIGKLSSKLKMEGNKVLIAAADTFRAAAIDQLKTWGDRANVDVISHNEGADPAAVIFDGITAAKSRNSDILICDTAGRLHNKANLMKELEKINRVIDREYPNANRETLLVLDATTGQNAMNQAKTFKEVCSISGIVLTKLDGTAKGGVVIALQSELQIPIKLVGVGEGIDDLQEFELNSFIDAIFD
ncbi:MULTISPECIES: signal recognition particle-docking protein FtsY [Peptoniphilus]|uniref:signal recognition particle-docking protein FtsY n=1 Tax=Peptoniphilus TaxID=162289 RepID=UPI0001DA9BB0|nr:MULTISPECIES: signal recognition particle-docking protein FtsY [Peptoniphilus]EFI42354.1 signal recognition particle-docking protein FtsY [Peptoniphilus sp. oral taxon 386 str. F0131]